MTLEAAGVFIDNYKIILDSVYHSPAGDSLTFLEHFDKLLNYLSHWSNYVYFIGGDFDKPFDLTLNNSLAKQFNNILRQHNFYFLNRLPT